MTDDRLEELLSMVRTNHLRCLNSLDENVIVKNVDLFGLRNSVIGMSYPKRVDILEQSVNLPMLKRAIVLAGTGKGEGHDNFLNGIVVQFDLTFTIKAWTEMERYNFITFISSQSTMHCVTQFNIDDNCNNYCDDVIKNRLEELKGIYLKSKESEDFLKLLYNIPVGFQLTAKMTTNYRQLKTIYKQRKLHRLPEWRKFCGWIETLPFFDDFISDSKSIEKENQLSLLNSEEFKQFCEIKKDLSLSEFNKMITSNCIPPSTSMPNIKNNTPDL